MNFGRNKTTTTMIALILMSIFAISLVALPTVNAHDPPWSFESYAYVIAAPNPVGVGQTTYISMWVDNTLPGALAANDIRRRDYTLTITDPDGKTTTQHWDIIQDSTGIQFTSFAPDQVGTYTIKFDYPEQTFDFDTPYQSFFGAPIYPHPYVNDTFSAATATVQLVVQEEQLPDPISSYPLPTEYWTRPIEAENTGWYLISSNWLSGAYIRCDARTQDYGTAPNSAHVMWTKPVDTGGVVGGNYSDIQGEGFYIGRSYNARFANPIVMNGILYYELPLGNAGTGGGYMAVDIRTGEELWYNDKMGVSGSGLSVPSFGYYVDVNHMNQHGVIPQGYLITSTWSQIYSASTGKLVYNVTDVPSGPEVVDEYGAVLRYEFNSAGKWLAQWNSSRMWSYHFGSQTPSTGTLNATYNPYEAKHPSTYDWNVTISGLGSGTWSIATISRSQASSPLIDLDNILLLTQGSLGSWNGRYEGSGMNITAISLEPSSLGRILWTKFYAPAPGNSSRFIQNWDPDAGVFVMYDMYTLERIGYSLDDGSELWTTETDTINSYGYFDYFFPGFAAYGNLYYSGYCGVLHCWDIKTGELKWTYGNGGAGNSTFDVQQPWGYRPLMIQLIADGKIYASGDEHSPNTPLYKDNLVRCINATDGTEIWTMKGWICGRGGGGDPMNSFVADGFLGYINVYDMQIYVVGKGPSATSVSIQNDVTTHGKKVLVQGSVIDVAAGTEQDEQAARFPNGVPAVSDASMGEWMEYVYMQKPKPTNVTGVEVIISVLDPNNNCYEVAKTTSDASGFYSCEFIPEVPGKYTVIATFAGSESYWGSSAETALYVEEAPQPTPVPTPTPASAADLYFVPMSIGILVAIIVVGLVLVLLLRKR